MLKSMSTDLKAVIEKVEQLPAEQRDVLVQELAEHVAEFTTVKMTDQQRAEVKRRMAAPREHVPENDVRELFRRYTPAL